MTHQSPTEDEFDSFLSRSLHNQSPYIADDGFSAQVVAKVAKPRPHLRWANAIAALLIGLIIGMQLPWLGILTRVSNFALTLNLGDILVAGAMSLVAVAGITLVWLAREFKWL